MAQKAITQENLTAEKSSAPKSKRSYKKRGAKTTPNNVVRLPSPTRMTSKDHSNNPDDILCRSMLTKGVNIQKAGFIVTSTPNTILVVKVINNVQFLMKIEDDTVNHSTKQHITVQMGSFCFSFTSRSIRVGLNTVAGKPLVCKKAGINPQHIPENVKRVAYLILESLDVIRGARASH